MLVCVTKSLLSIHRDINNFLDCEIHAYKFSRKTDFCSCLSDVTMMMANLKMKTKFAIKDVRFDRQCTLIDNKNTLF